MPKPDNDSCGTCLFWLCTSKIEGRGICQKAPPVVLLYPETGEPCTFWPQVEEYEWCGEWKR